MPRWSADRIRDFKQSPDWLWFWRLISWPVAVCLAAKSHLVRWTLKVSVEGPGADYGGPAVYVNWHRHLPFLGLHHGQRRRWLMVSPAAYLEPVARWCELLGLRVVRGTSGEKGREALAELLGHLRRGESAFLAVDGPAGPPFKVKRGCVDLARAAGVPIIPVAYGCKRGKHHPKRWDHWLAVKAFDEIVVTYGKPILIGGEEDEFDAIRRVEEGLREVSGALGMGPAWKDTLIGR